MTTETASTIDWRNEVVVHPTTGMLHAAHLMGRPQCNSRTKKLHRMVTADFIASTSDEMFCEKCFPNVQRARDAVANGRIRVAI